MSNQNAVLNRVLSRWLELPRDLAPNVDCERCTLSLKEPNFARRWYEYKCCAFQPFVANFICGAMLEAGIPLAVDGAKAALHPIGVVARPEFRVQVESVADRERGEAHLCTFYNKQDRRCSIWEYRPGECSLYYCGGDEKRLAREDHSEQIFALESGLAQMALAYLGFEPHAIAEQVEVLNHTSKTTGARPELDVLEIYRRSWDWAKSQTIQDIDNWLSFDNADADE